MKNYKYINIKPLQGAWDPNREVLEACEPVSAKAAESWGFTKDAYWHEQKYLS